MITLILIAMFSSISIKADIPLPRAYHQMVYDSESDRIIVYGGLTKPGDDKSWIFETWSYDYNQDNWIKMPFPPIDDGNGNGNGTEPSSLLMLSSFLGVIALAILIRYKKK